MLWILCYNTYAPESETYHVKISGPATMMNFAEASVLLTLTPCDGFL